MSNEQAVPNKTQPPLAHMKSNFQEIRTSSGRLLFELDYRRMVVRIKKNGNFEFVDLLTQIQQLETM